MITLLQTIHWDELIRSKVLVAGLGLFTHSILMHGEWDRATHLIVSTWIVAWGAMTIVEYKTDARVNTTGEALQVATSALATYLGALISSILVYRAFFHRLRAFPGPFLLRLSKLFNLIYVFPSRQYYNSIEKLHKEYKADVIRTGPREVHVFSADAIPVIHGPMSKCTKSGWYSNTRFIDGDSVHTERDKKVHRERRKDWDKALSATSLREYEPRVNRHSYALMARLQEQARVGVVRISSWINYYSFDVMGDVGFSRSFGMIEKGKEDHQIALLHNNMGAFSVLSHIYWMMALLLRIGGAKDVIDFMDWAGDVLRDRVKITPKERDIIGFIFNPDDEDIPMQLNADTRLLLVAGSDTTAATLTWLCYELCKNPSVQAKLRDQVDKIAPEKAFLDAEDLTNCAYLDGVINETLRLHPAVPSGVSRETPPEGVTLPDGTYIPAETIVWMPPHTIQRDPRYFTSPLTFAPSRWISEPDSEQESPYKVLDKRAFFPFLTGVYNCVGQKLAMMELRSVTANLVRMFDMQFKEGETGETVVKGTRDCFTLVVGTLDVKLTPRTSGQ